MNPIDIVIIVLAVLTVAGVVLSRLFKKNMGVSYLQYVYQVRTTAVCRELETTEDPISEIAERNGFRDPKMLNQYFREIYGCTPSEKRKFFREVTIEETDSPEED